MVVSNKRIIPLIKYTSRDAESIKKDLDNYRRRYYSNISKDSNEASFDDMVLDMVSYVGDILSFYIDYSVNESFLDTAVEFNNILKGAKQLGYKFKPSPAAVGSESFYAIIPARSLGLGPDPNYIPILKKGSELASGGGNGYLLNEDVNFANPGNPVVVARVDQSTGIPTAYAIKAYGQVISGRISQEIITIGAFQKFLKIALTGQNISEIISVVDSDGNEYFEVDYLTQDVVYRAYINPGIDRPTIPNLLRPVVVPRRYVVEFDQNRTYLQFGFGSDKDSKADVLIDPSRPLLNIHGRNYVTDVSLDPSNLLGTNKMGVVPANTSLTIIYRTNISANVNAAPNSITKLVSPQLDFPNLSVLSSEQIATVANSIECTNEYPVVGDVALPSTRELKQRAYGSFNAQNRAVTSLDYKSFAYSMPSKFGAVKRANIVQDPDSFRRDLNVYIVSENFDTTLTTASTTLKTNFKMWLNQGKMINDVVNILDAYIINFGIDFIVLADTERNKFDVQNDCIENLRRRFLFKEDIGAPFSLTNIYNILSKTAGVADAIKVKLYTKVSAPYSSTAIDLDSLMSADGRFVNVPKNCILEMKYPTRDIRGSVK